MQYYRIPLRCDLLMQGQHLSEEAEAKESIHQNIKLILESFTQSYSFDPSFGSVISKYQACTPPQDESERIWRENIRQEIQRNLMDMMTRYETRITVTDLGVSMSFPQKRSSDPSVNLRISIEGQLNLGRNERFHYPDSAIAPGAQEVFPLRIPVGRVK